MTFGTHDKTSYILNRRDDSIREIRLDKELDQLNDCIIKEIIRYSKVRSSRWTLGLGFAEAFKLCPFGTCHITTK